MSRAEYVQPIASGVVAAITGFASSFALVIAGLVAVGASDTEAASGLLALCLVTGILPIVLSWRYRMPLAFAWSTPGAAVLVAAGATTGEYSAAVGAFLVCGALLLLTGLWPWLARMMTSIPKSIASAMLAGILFPICLAPVTAAVELPFLALPAILVWLVLQRFAPRWSVPAAVVATAVAIVISAGGDWLDGGAAAPVLAFAAPTLDPAAIIGLGIPLYIVTMAGQNVPGFAVLSTFGYTTPPARVMLSSTGIGTLVGAPFGGFTVNLAAITAAMMAGPDSHPDRAKRWIAAVAGGITYLVLGLGAGVATALVSASPPILITSVAGLALLGALVSAVS
ncbi:MAG: benzoate/H(+) symporter BenE family transporter, partial [Microbacteriaceae bacterium]